MGKINSKAKGRTYEQQIRKELRETFYPDCERSSYVSKYEDDVAKGDLVNTGNMFRFQLKATEKAPNFQEVLKEMKDDHKINCVFHKRNRKGEVVVMSKEDFYAVISMLKMNGIL